MIKLMGLIDKKLVLEKVNYNKELTDDERVLLSAFARSGREKKVGDFEAKEIDVPLESEYRGHRKIAKTPIWKSGPAKGLPQTERTGRTTALFYKGKEILRIKEGPFAYPKDLVKMLNSDKYEPAKRYNGGLALVGSGPYERKLRVALGFIASKTVKQHWVEETPLRDIKKAGL